MNPLVPTSMTCLRLKKKINQSTRKLTRIEQKKRSVSSMDSILHHVRKRGTWPNDINRLSGATSTIHTSDFEIFRRGSFRLSSKHKSLLFKHSRHRNHASLSHPRFGDILISLSRSTNLSAVAPPLSLSLQSHRSIGKPLPISLHL